MKTLLDRCRDFMAPYRVGMEPADDRDAQKLIDFVCVEVGRAADPRLDQSLPLVLYFDNDGDRQAMIEAVQAEKPNWKWRKP